VIFGQLALMSFGKVKLPVDEPPPPPELVFEPEQDESRPGIVSAPPPASASFMKVRRLCPRAFMHLLL
jgi:hypothetical protein